MRRCRTISSNQPSVKITASDVPRREPHQTAFHDEKESDKQAALSHAPNNGNEWIPVASHGLPRQDGAPLQVVNEGVFSRMVDRVSILPQDALPITVQRIDGKLTNQELGNVFQQYVPRRKMDPSEMGLAVRNF